MAGRVFAIVRTQRTPHHTPIDAVARLVAWLLAAELLLVSAAPSAAQSSPGDDVESPPEQNAQPELRSDFPYGVLLADIGSAPRASEAGFRVMAATA